MTGASRTEGRVAALRKIMREKGIDTLLITRRENVRYVTGFTGSAGSVLIGGKGRPLLVTDFRYREQARHEVAFARTVIQKKDHVSAIAAAVGQMGTNALWYDETSLTMDQVKALRKLKLSLRGIKDPAALLRQLKDPYELSLIRKAVRRAEQAFYAVLPHVRPGVMERELGLRLEVLIREQGSRRAAFDIIVASGPNGAMPHATASNRRIRSGDLVTFDFGAEADGYYSDITRTVCVGRPSPRQREVHGTVLRAQKQAIDAVLPGARCADIDRAARGFIEQAGHGKDFGHATGHGIGLMVHEGPSISSLSKQRVERGMVFTIEPGIYVPGWGGVRIEDMVLVTDNGCRVLTSLPRGLWPGST